MCILAIGDYVVSSTEQYHLLCQVGPIMMFKFVTSSIE